MLQIPPATAPASAETAAEIPDRQRMFHRFCTANSRRVCTWIRRTGNVGPCRLPGVREGPGEGSAMTPEERRSQRQLGGELVIPVLAIVFTIYYFTTIWNSPWTAQVSAFLVGGVLLTVCGVFLLVSALKLRQGEGSLGFRNLVSMEDWRTGRVGLFAATIGYCVFVGAARLHSGHVPVSPCRDGRAVERPSHGANRGPVGHHRPDRLGGVHLGVRHAFPPGLVRALDEIGTDPWIALRQS